MLEVGYYLQAHDIIDLFDRVLTRLEKDCGVDLVREAASLIDLSRNGLEHAALQEIRRPRPCASRRWSSVSARAYGSALAALALPTTTCARRFAPDI